jgi:hypothetical protein
VSERDAGNELADRAQEYLERAVKAEAQADRLRALLQQAGEALDGVIAVADRKTVEFDRARTARAAITTELGEHK